MKGFPRGFIAWLTQLTETDKTAFWDDMGEEAASIDGIKDFIIAQINKLVQKAPLSLSLSPIENNQYSPQQPQ